MAGNPSRSTRRAATQAADTTPSVPSATLPAPSVEAVSDVSADVSAAPAPASEPEPIPEPIPEPTREPTFNVELRLASAALSGASAYHVTWPASRIRTLLSGALAFVPVPVMTHLPGQAAPNAARYVYIQNIAEVVIHGWPQD